MKPRPIDEIRRLRANIDTLGTAIRHAVEDAEQARLEREKLLQEQWRLQRESATHRRTAQDYDKLQAENERLQETTDTVKEALHGILAWSKAAGADLRR